MGDADYEVPSDLNKIGYYSVYLEKWQVDSEGAWSAYSVPLTFHRCNESDLSNFYRFQREEELGKRVLLSLNCLDSN